MEEITNELVFILMYLFKIIKLYYFCTLFIIVLLFLLFVFYLDFINSLAHSLNVVYSPQANHFLIFISLSEVDVGLFTQDAFLYFIIPISSFFLYCWII